jgi:hypothetical protein
MIGVVAGGCGGKSGEKPREISGKEIELAQAAVGSYKKALQTKLREALREGPENAIDVCQIKAPEIAKGLSVDGVAVGRTSHRLRNPKNAPAPWLEPLLAAYLNEGDDNPWRAVRLDDGSIGYAEPIYVQPVCLKCHGGDLTDTVARNIAGAYPDDEAVGFAAGEFRGLFWATLDAESLDG